MMLNVIYETRLLASLVCVAGREGEEVLNVIYVEVVMDS